MKNGRKERGRRRRRKGHVGKNQGTNGREPGGMLQ
jgi:hypothetical protein